MAYVRKFKTDAELAAFRSQMAKNRKNRKGGRPKGWTKDPALKTVPTRNIGIRQPDYEVFYRCASALQKPIIAYMHDVAESIKEQNPSIFRIKVNPPVVGPAAEEREA